MATKTDRRGGYKLDLTIPAEWWSGTDTVQTEVTRARRRAQVRRYARDKWRELKRSGGAWKVNRFVALIAVAYPNKSSIFPARAAETVKPIIDGGSDARLWDDDDSQHRHSTIYIQLPAKAPAGHYSLTVLIIPVSDRNPIYQVTGGLADNIVRHWAGRRDRPAWDTGYTVSFSIPDKLWITSNFTDSDLAARQRGARKSRTWGNGRSFGVREKVTGRLTEHALTQWRAQNYCGYERFIIIAGIAYPYGVDRADPDNCAETVNAILNAGTLAGAWYDTNFDHCKGVAFFRLPNLYGGGRHVVKLFVIPVPDSFQLAAAVADSADESWEEHDRRLRS